MYTVFISTNCSPSLQIRMVILQCLVLCYASISVIYANTTHLEIKDSLYDTHGNKAAVPHAIHVHEYVQERKPDVRGNSIFAPFTNFFKTRPQELDTSESSAYPYALPATSGLEQGVYDFNGGNFVTGYHDGFHNHGSHGHEHDHGHAQHSLHKHLYARDIAMGFIGFLIVLSTLQNALISVSRSADSRIAIHGHKRREVTTPKPDMVKLPEITLSPIGTIETTSVSSEEINTEPQGKKDKWLLHEDENIRCLQKKACIANKELVEQYGMTGKVLASYISKLTIKKKAASGYMRLVQDAGLAGLKGVDCSVLYRGCHKVVDPKT